MNGFFFKFEWKLLPDNTVQLYVKSQSEINLTGGVMVNMLSSSAEDDGFDPQKGQTKDYKICICCLPAKHATLRRMRKNWSTQNRDNVFGWNDMSTHRLLFQWAIKIQLCVLV